MLASFLGAGETGKSTFLKQMRILHGEGYSAEERLRLAPLVHKNVLVDMQAILGAMDATQLDIAHASEINQASFCFPFFEYYLIAVILGGA